MLKENMKIEMIMKITKLTKEEILEIEKNNCIIYKKWVYRKVCVNFKLLMIIFLKSISEC